MSRETFIGGCRKNNKRTIVIKTHALPNQNLIYDKAVLIIRDPFDALLAEFNRQNSGKLLVAPKEEFLSESE